MTENQNNSQSAGKLFIVATPIGNLADITLRALETLKGVDFVACEDTRTSKKLLTHYDIPTPTVSFHQHSGEVKTEQIVKRILGGENAALVTDAGTPGISDPGGKLVAAALAAGIQVVPIPGVAAVTTLASIAGVDLSEFAFWGFVPHKKGRETFFKKIALEATPIFFYESSHRIEKCLEQMNNLCSAKQLIVGRELTKLFEEVLRGTPAEVQQMIAADPHKTKGEFVILAV